MKIEMDTIVLKKGAHRSPEEGLCLLEAVAYVRGIPHTDHPPCVSPVLGAFGRCFNDNVDDDFRQQLTVLIPPASRRQTVPRYKALGNAMAVNVMSWIGQRIQLVSEIKDNQAVA